MYPEIMMVDKPNGGVYISGVSVDNFREALHIIDNNACLVVNQHP